MGEALYHHGIKGMKWGVRRTPKQLGHDVPKKRPGGTTVNAKSAVKAALAKGRSAVKSTVRQIATGSKHKKASSMSNDELKTQIERLNMEERYDDLVSRKKARGESYIAGLAKRVLKRGAENLGNMLVDKAISSISNKLTKKEDPFDIDEYKDADVNKMDAETISKVSKWYSDAMKIKNSREKLAEKDDTKKEDTKKDDTKKDDTKKEDPFDIDKYKDVDVNKMDAETISKVSKWYSDAMKIKNSREKLAEKDDTKNDDARKDSTGSEWAPKSAGKRSGSGTGGKSGSGSSGRKLSLVRSGKSGARKYGMGRARTKATNELIRRSEKRRVSELFAKGEWNPSKEPWRLKKRYVDWFDE